MSMDMDGDLGRECERGVGRDAAGEEAVDVGRRVVRSVGRRRCEDAVCRRLARFVTRAEDIATASLSVRRRITGLT
jgi:hypothetical protein